MQSKSINWSSTDLGSLATQFEKAVGYANKTNETPKRRKTGSGYLYKLVNGGIPRLGSLELEPDGTNVKAEPLPPVNTNKQDVKGAR